MAQKNPENGRKGLLHYVNTSTTIDNVHFGFNHQNDSTMVREFKQKLSYFVHDMVFGNFYFFLTTAIDNKQVNTMQYFFLQLLEVVMEFL